MQVQLPNGVSILIGVALVAALTAIAGALPGEMPDWTGLALAAVIGGVAKAIQVWLDSQREVVVSARKWNDVTNQYDEIGVYAWRRWLVG